MKLDALNFINLILIITSISVIFSYIKYSYKKTIYKIHSSLVHKKLSYALNYSKKLSPIDFFVFEKYEIWRYSFLF